MLSRDQMEAFLAAHPPLDGVVTTKGADAAKSAGHDDHDDHGGHGRHEGQGKAGAHDHPPQLPRQQDHDPHWIADAGRYLRDHNIAIASERDGGQGEHIYVLAACVWDPSHTDHAAIVEQWPDGTVTAKCSHHSCAGKSLTELRDAVEGPGWRVSAGQADHHGRQPK